MLAALAGVVHERQGAAHPKHEGITRSCGPQTLSPPASYWLPSRTKHAPSCKEKRPVKTFDQVKERGGLKGCLGLTIRDVGITTCLQTRADKPRT